MWSTVLSNFLSVESVIAVIVGVVGGMVIGALPGLKCFVAAVLGGIGSIPGAVIGGFIIGISETFLVALGYSTFSDAFTFVLLIIILLVRPTGLFGEAATDKV